MIFGLPENYLGPNSANGAHGAVGQCLRSLDPVSHPLARAHDVDAFLQGRQQGAVDDMRVSKTWGRFLQEILYPP